jgi:hypothetical protein
VPVSALPAFVAEASAWVHAHAVGGTLIAYGHAGDGNLHFNINWLDGVAAPDLAREEPIIKRAIHDLVAAHGGSISAEHGIGRLKVGDLQRYTSAVELDMMRARPQGHYESWKTAGAVTPTTEMGRTHRKRLDDPPARTQIWDGHPTPRYALRHVVVVSSGQ